MSGEQPKRGRGRPRISADGGVMVTRTVGMTQCDWAVVQKAADEVGDSLSAALRRIVNAWDIAVERRAALVREMADLDAMGVAIAREDTPAAGEDFRPI